MQKTVQICAEDKPTPQAVSVAVYSGGCAELCRNHKVVQEICAELCRMLIVKVNASMGEGVSGIGGEGLCVGFA